MHHYAFLVGINDYKPPISSLLTPVNDIEAIGEKLENEFSYQVHHLLNPGKEQLVRFFKEGIPELLAKAPLDSNVLVYFAGHGYAEETKEGLRGYLIPADATRANDTWFSMGEMLDAIRSLPHQHLLLVLDCCFGGAIRWASRFRGITGFGLDHEITSQHYRYFTEHKSRQILTSASPSQSALDFLGHGEIGDYSPFAYAFLKGLSGEADSTPDKVILVSELYNYLQHQLPLLTDEKQNVGLVSLPEHDHGEYLFPLNGFNPNSLKPIDFNNPYQGLAAFERENKDFFFGREKAVKELLEKVNANPLTVVVGASGTGKSSLVKAGLAPILPGRTEIMAPGRNPEVAVKNLPSFDNLVVDQLEQLITQSAKETVGPFLEQIEEWLATGKKVIATVRIDFEKQLELPESLAQKWEEGRFLIPPFSAEELREIIVAPALRVGRFFEPINLAERIVEEVIHYPGSLPLLSFTMQQLFEHCNDKTNLFRRISEPDYRALGGVVGALQNSADTLYQSFSQEEQRTMQYLMLRMVSLAGGETAGRRVMESELQFEDTEENTRMKKVSQALVDARLVHTGKDGDHNPYLEPSHDALVRVWRRVQEWIKEFGEGNILLLDKVGDAVNEYQAGNADRRRLWAGNPNLESAQKLLRDHPALFNRAEKTFITDSLAEKKRRTRRNRAIAMAVFTVISIAAFVAFQQREAAKEQAKIAQDELHQREIQERLKERGYYNKFILDGDVFFTSQDYDLALIKFKRADSLYQKYLSQEQDESLHSGFTELRKKIDSCMFFIKTE
ncbi:MAG: caspase family protein [Saprospiraceae bacterium]